MPALPTPGIIQAKRVTTGRLYLKPQLSPGVFEPYEIDLGNVVKWKRANKTEQVEHMASGDGVRFVDYSHTHTLGWGYVFTLDEYTPSAIERLQKAAEGTTVNQALAAPASTVTINDVVQGFTYSVGKLNVTLESVKVAAAVKTGYTWNPKTGRITILPGGDIADLADIIVQFGAPAASFTRHVSGSQPNQLGRFSFYESDQHSPLVRAVHTWDGSMSINDDAEQTAEAYGTLELTCICHTPPVLDERQN